ncbi:MULTISPECIES: hypothetical protein [Rhodomicrobium]|uniref:hypothetical protein n=1 Tax=Rhodomicrobium TaxID=1068 RepID=UPI000B4B8F3F|nr:MULTISPECIES: hypothetical protein [Rhodomicrobium]
MFGSLIDYVKLSAASATTRIISVLAVAVPLLIAASFGLAAIYIAISNRYDSLTAAISLAVAFVILAVIALIAVTIWRKKQEALRQEALMRARRTAAASALMAVNPALLLGAGRMAVGLARRAPLLIMLPLAAGFIFALTRSSSPDEEKDHVA